MSSEEKQAAFKEKLAEYMTSLYSYYCSNGKNINGLKFYEIFESIKKDGFGFYGIEALVVVGALYVGGQAATVTIGIFAVISLLTTIFLFGCAKIVEKDDMISSFEIRKNQNDNLNFKIKADENSLATLLVTLAGMRISLNDAYAPKICFHYLLIATVVAYGIMTGGTMLYIAIAYAISGGIIDPLYIKTMQNTYKNKICPMFEKVQ